MKAIRVGYVSVLDASDTNQWSGIPAAVLRELENQGVDVVRMFPLRRDFRFVLAPQQVAARLRHLSAGIDRHPLALWYVAKQIEHQLRKKPVDLIFCPSSVAISALSCRVPIVYWTDAVWHNFYGYYPVDVTAAANRMARNQEEAALARATLAVYASNWAADAAKKLVDASKVRVLHFGANVDVRHTEQDLQAWVDGRISRMRTNLSLLFVGVDWVRKGGDIVIDVARRLNELGIHTTVKLVGSRPPGKLPDFVVDVGFVDRRTEAGREQLAELFRESDLFILPTRAEAAGIVFAEASAFGLPILTFATGGVTDYVRPDVNGFAIERTHGVEEFVALARRLIDEPVLYRTLAMSGYRDYVERLNWTASVRKLVNLFHEAIATTGRAHPLNSTR